MNTVMRVLIFRLVLISCILWTLLFIYGMKGFPEGNLADFGKGFRQKDDDWIYDTIKYGVFIKSW